ncbi:MAG: hypothetical protein ACI9DH_001531 [Halioglobus sp.]
MKLRSDLKAEELVNKLGLPDEADYPTLSKTPIKAKMGARILSLTARDCRGLER